MLRYPSECLLKIVSLQTMLLSLWPTKNRIGIYTQSCYVSKAFGYYNDVTIFTMKIL